MLTHPDILAASARDRAQALLDEAANERRLKELPCSGNSAPRLNSTVLLALFGFQKPCLEPAVTQLS